MNTVCRSKERRKYPAWLRRSVGWLSQKVFGVRPEVEAVYARQCRSENIRLRVQTQVLWANAHRAWLTYGHQNGHPIDAQEWLDLQQSLNEVRPLDFDEILGK